MFANKLKHNKPGFVAVRGAVAWMLMMGMWFVYPYVQRSHYASNAKVESQQKKKLLFVADDEQEEETTRGLKTSAAINGRASFDPFVAAESAFNKSEINRYDPDKDANVKGVE